MGINGRREEEVVKQETTQERNEAQTRILNKEEDCDVLGGASEIAGGRYFVVRSGGTGALPDGTIG
jgi:hypothetical protein